MTKLSRPFGPESAVMVPAAAYQYTCGQDGAVLLKHLSHLGYREGKGPKEKLLEP